jgi:hypothetical protein
MSHAQMSCTESSSGPSWLPVSHFGALNSGLRDLLRAIIAATKSPAARSGSNVLLRGRLIHLVSAKPS